jgi:hypothetical protein
MSRVSLSGEAEVQKRRNVETFGHGRRDVPPGEELTTLSDAVVGLRFLSKSEKPFPLNIDFIPFFAHSFSASRDNAAELATPG